MDRISNLPDDILSSLLSLFTIREATKMRVLSSKWRHLSASTPNLQFDTTTLFGFKYPYDYPKHKDGEMRFVRIVDEYLDQCQTPKAYSFKVCYSLGGEFSANIDRWICLAMKLQVQKLELNFCCHGYRPSQPYEFPHRLFSQAKHLVDLCLCFCTLSQTTFDHVLSSCVNLKLLKLEHCELPNSLTIRSSSHMKSMIIYGCEGAKRIDVSVVLTTFEYLGDMTRLRFVGRSLVEKVCLCFQTGRVIVNKQYAFSGFLADDLPQLQYLSLIVDTSTTRKFPINMRPFCHLKELQLALLLYSDFDLFSVVGILNASPCLQNFLLALRHDYDPRDKLKKQRISKQFYHNLKEIEISGFRDRCRAFDLAIYLMEHAVGLQRMIINHRKRWNYGRDTFSNFSFSHYCNEDERKKTQDVLSRKNVQNVELIVM